MSRDPKVEDVVNPCAWSIRIASSGDMGVPAMIGQKQGSVSKRSVSGPVCQGTLSARFSSKPSRVEISCQDDSLGACCKSRLSPRKGYSFEVVDWRFLFTGKLEVFANPRP